MAVIEQPRSWHCSPAFQLTWMIPNDEWAEKSNCPGQKVVRFNHHILHHRTLGRCHFTSRDRGGRLLVAKWIASPVVGLLVEMVPGRRCEQGCLGSRRRRGQAEGRDGARQRKEKKRKFHDCLKTRDECIGFQSWSSKNVGIVGREKD